MDEATIDCTICGHDGWLEVRVETLDNEANWRTVYRYVMCRRHLDRLHTSWDLLGNESRIIAQRCG